MDPVQAELQRYIDIRDRLQKEVQEKEEQYNFLLGRLRAFEIDFLHHVDPLQQRLARWNHRCSVVEGVLERLGGMEKHEDVPLTSLEWRQEIEAQLQSPKEEPLPPRIPELSPIERTEAKRLYRDLARRFHPDLVQSEEKQTKRRAVMADVNRSYQENDLEGLRVLQHRPDIVEEEEERVGDIWTRLVREIAMLRKSIANKEGCVKDIEVSDLGLLMHQLGEEAEERFNPLMQTLMSKVRIQKERWRQLRVQEEERWLERDE
jgi:hypothetical protein